ncbi:hypothetical protein ACIREE_17865 [Streptomyces sp. NPDC102467]|uniref:hypothetical protein n=1 Tax=Streptomyces sp. NPDC102467 TaxID=3366179 RepID=UPI003810BD99
MRRVSHPYAGLPARGAGSRISWGEVPCSCAEDDGSAVVADGVGVGVGVSFGGAGDDGVTRGGLGFTGGVVSRAGGAAFDGAAPCDAEAAGEADPEAEAAASGPADDPSLPRARTPLPLPLPETSAPPSSTVPPPRCAAECEGAGGRPSSATLMHPAAAATATVVAAMRLSRRAQSDTDSWRTGAPPGT